MPYLCKMIVVGNTGCGVYGRYRYYLYNFSADLKLFLKKVYFRIKELGTLLQWESCLIQLITFQHFFFVCQWVCLLVCWFRSAVRFSGNCSRSSSAPRNVLQLMCFSPFLKLLLCKGLTQHS